MRNIAWLQFCFVSCSRQILQDLIFFFFFWGGGGGIHLKGIIQELLVGQLIFIFRHLKLALVRGESKFETPPPPPLPRNRDSGDLFIQKFPTTSPIIFLWVSLPGGNFSKTVRNLERLVKPGRAILFCALVKRTFISSE